jgi:hypothetical protein
MFRRRWVRRVAVGLLAGLLLITAGFFGIRHRTERMGVDRLAAITAHLDATDPRWRLEEIEADRPTLPDDQNSALLVPRFKAALVAPRFEIRRGDGKYVFFTGPPNRHLSDEEMAAIDRALLGNDAALAIARSFRDHPRGVRRYAIPADYFGTPMDGLQDTRTMFDVLTAEAERLGRDGRPGAALELVQALRNAARSIDGDPFLIAALNRIAGDGIAARRVERVLGQAAPTGRLADVQADLAGEAESDFFWWGVRGERAGVHRIFENIRSGRYSFRSAMTYPDWKPGSASAAERVDDWLYRSHLPGEHAEVIDALTRAYDLRQLPDHEQQAARRAIEDSVPPAPGFFAAQRVIATFGRVHTAGLRTKALLRCTATGVAVERFRQRTGRWPASLAELPKDLCPAVPLDPFDGNPLKYVRRDDGVTVYSIGPDEQDNGGEGGETGGGTRPGTDVCFRLYDPDQRGLPPLPPPAADNRELPSPVGLPRAPEPRVIRE